MIKSSGLDSYNHSVYKIELSFYNNNYIPPKSGPKKVQGMAGQLNVFELICKTPVQSVVKQVCNSQFLICENALFSFGNNINILFELGLCSEPEKENWEKQTRYLIGDLGD